MYTSHILYYIYIYIFVIIFLIQQLGGSIQILLPSCKKKKKNKNKNKTKKNKTKRSTQQEITSVGN